MRGRERGPGGLGGLKEFLDQNKTAENKPTKTSRIERTMLKGNPDPGHFMNFR
jgi:hypothetical protein